MKNIKKIIITTFLIVIIWGNLNAQNKSNKGLYVSMGFGPGFGSINAISTVASDNLKIKGTGIAFDIQLGGFVTKSVALHASMGAKSIIGPTVNNVKLDGSYSFDEVIFGAGVTGYSNSNFFLTGNVGAGSFSFDDENVSGKTDFGFSYQIKIGKEWWVSPTWRAGISAEYGATKLMDKYDNITDKWSSNRLSIKLSATLCYKPKIN